MMYAEPIKKLIKDYGLAAVGFYQLALTRMAINDGWLPKSELEFLYCRGMKVTTIDKILEESGLFEFIEPNVVIVSDIENNCIHDFRNSVFYLCRKQKPWLTSRTHTGALAGAQASGQASKRASERACEQVGEQVSVRSGHSKPEDKIREEKERLSNFNKFMNHYCPHLLEMTEPLDYDDYQKLRSRFTAEQIMEVLVAMENENDLYLTKRNCFQTALNWLNHRKQWS